MESKKTVCDKCKKEIKGGYEKRSMLIFNVDYPFQYNDGGSCPAVDRETERYHFHFDCAKFIFKACPQIIPHSLK